MKTTTLAIAAAMTAGTLAHAQEAVQWRVEDGGNGHWYQVVPTGPIAGQDAHLAVPPGAMLATMTDLPEQEFVSELASAQDSAWTTVDPRNTVARGPWFGLSVDADCNAYWATGEVVDYANWLPGQPTDCDAQPYCQLWIRHVGEWVNNNGTDPTRAVAVLVEYSADCNGDGVVDYGQILAGTLADVNGNGIPDTCECIADVNQDGVVNGADISAVLGFWGQAGKPLPAADITRDGLVDGADIAVLLGSWGECP